MTDPRTEYLWMHDIAGDQVGVLSELHDLVHEEILDELETLDFEIAAADPQVGLVVVDTELRWRARRFFVAARESRRDGAEVFVHAECRALWYRLGENTHVGAMVLSSVTPAAGLAAILEGSGWIVAGGTTTDTTAYSLDEQDKTVLELLRIWATTTGKVIVWDTGAKEVRLADDRGLDIGVSFRIGKNILGGTHREEAPYCTVLFPFGAESLNIAGLNGGLPYLENFDYYTDQGLTLTEARALYTRTRVWSDTSIIVDTILLAQATAKLAVWSQPTVSYQADVVDISELTSFTETVAAGDVVTVFDPAIELDQDITVTRLVNHPLQPWTNEIELAVDPEDSPANSDSERATQSGDWAQFLSTNESIYKLRNDGRFVLARIPLQFSESGQANYHVDFYATGVGAGTLTCELYDASAAVTIHRIMSVAYTNGQLVHDNFALALDGLDGEHDYRLRFIATNSGGPSTTAGVDFAVGDCRFYIMALGAVQQTPTAQNSQRFDYTGAVQKFTVPDDITEVTIEAHGSKGIGFGTGLIDGGHGGSVTITVDVTPGSIYDVHVAELGFGIGDFPGKNGGGYTSMVLEGGALSASLVVAPGGGGAGDTFAGNATRGGDGGFFAGTAGLGARPGLGATATAGGAAGLGGVAGSAGQGGDAGDTTNFLAFAGGGGGGGKFGGGGAGAATLNGSYAGGGGGGVGDYTPAAWDVILADGDNNGNGYLIVSWDDPIEF